MESVYNQVKNFKRKYPTTITHHRLKKHAKIVEKFLNPGETVNYAFVAQKNAKTFDFFETAIIAVTNERVLIGQKRVLFGYFINSITPDLYNDMQIYRGLIWGKITIDTVKEIVVLTNLPKKSLDEIETTISEFMMEAKKKYKNEQKDK